MTSSYYKKKKVFRLVVLWETSHFLHRRFRKQNKKSVEKTKVKERVMHLLVVNDVNVSESLLIIKG